jgi:hypothetical protein
MAESVKVPQVRADTIQVWSAKMRPVQDSLREVRRGIWLNIGSLILLALVLILTISQGEVWISLAILAAILANGWATGKTIHLLRQLRR